MTNNWTVRVMQTRGPKDPISTRDVPFTIKREAVRFMNQVKEGNYVGKLDHTFMVFGKL